MKEQNEIQSDFIEFQLEEEKKLQSRLTETEERTERCKEVEKKAKQRVDVDLDVYMSGLSDEKVLDKTDIRKSRVTLLF